MTLVAGTKGLHRRIKITDDPPDLHETTGSVSAAAKIDALCAQLPCLPLFHFQGDIGCFALHSPLLFSLAVSSNFCQD